LIFILWLALPQTRGATKLWTDHKDKIEALYSVALTHLEKIQAVFSPCPLQCVALSLLKRFEAVFSVCVVTCCAVSPQQDPIGIGPLCCSVWQCILTCCAVSPREVASGIVAVFRGVVWYPEAPFRVAALSLCYSM